jgi:hypothetical protein
VQNAVSLADRSSNANGQAQFLTPRTLLSGGSFHEPHDKQQYAGADNRRYDRAEYPAAKIEAKSRKQFAGDERSDDADNNISNETKSAAFHDLASEPSGNSADYEPYNYCSRVHVFTPQLPLRSRIRALAIFRGKILIDKTMD